MPTDRGRRPREWRHHLIKNVPGTSRKLEIWARRILVRQPYNSGTSLFFLQISDGKIEMSPGPVRTDTLAVMTEMFGRIGPVYPSVVVPWSTCADGLGSCVSAFLAGAGSSAAVGDAGWRFSRRGRSACSTRGPERHRAARSGELLSLRTGRGPATGGASSRMARVWHQLPLL